ncbi:hypothetical protein K438DRAFT_1756052 [Mycena galopus ATCC 62051]|nr:hypothetical protein K438DRAFT_1756052 [Mycena galopus ATCC 62051]
MPPSKRRDCNHHRRKRHERAQQGGVWARQRGVTGITLPPETKPSLARMRATQHAKKFQTPDARKKQREGTQNKNEETTTRTKEGKKERKKEKTMKQRRNGRKAQDGPGMLHGRKEHGEQIKIKRRTQTATRSGSESTASMGWGENGGPAHPRWSAEQACGDGHVGTSRSSTQAEAEIRRKP